MKKGGEKDIVGDSETNAAASESSILEEPDDDKVDEVPFKDGDFEVPTENILKKRHSSTSHAIDIDECGISSTENDNFKLGIGIHSTMSSQLRTKCVRYSASVTGKVDFLSSGFGKFKELNENDNFKLVPTEMDITERVNFGPTEVEKFKAPTENGAKNTFGKIWIKNGLEGNNCTLVRELESYEKRSIKEAEQKISKVPTILRGVERVKECYDPRIVAIGLYHHDNVNLKKMETFKIQLTLQYADQSGKSIEELYKEMEKWLIAAKNYYVEDVVKDFNDKKFVDMMFLDSCFVIQFMYICLEPAENDIKTTYIETLLIMRDIMLLENQLPFKILTKLMSLSSRFEEGKEEKMINKFIKLIMNESRIEEKEEEEEEEEARKRKTYFWFCRTNSKSKGTTKKKKESIHFLELVQTKFVDDEEIEKGTSKKPSSNWCSHRSVKELKSVGIHLQPSKKSGRFSDITFNSMLLYGRLSLPRITIEDGTKSLLLNLVAFEACADTLSNFGVSSYVYFMDTLIDHAEDVKELRHKGIILNLLGSDQQVADLFNEISENLVPDIKVFGNVRDSLNAFYGSYPRLWLTECLHNHFSSPWALIAFFAAIVVLGLTITQTVFSAIQL